MADLVEIEFEMVGSFICAHCNRVMPNDEGAYDAIERAFGPICNDCAQFDVRRVLVCGGRMFGEVPADPNEEDRRRAIAEICQLYRVVAILSPRLILTGGAKGADSHARAYAQARRIECLSFPADWKRYGRRAGPLRNQQMLEKGKPSLVVAFPGGRGTADMMRHARAASVRVVEVNRDA